MDEKDCVFEIVDEVFHSVPKDDKSTSSSIDENIDQNDSTSDHHEILGRAVRSSSIASSISTPPLSENEQEREENSFSFSLRDERNAKPFILQRESPIRTSAQEQNVDLLDLFSTPPVANLQSNRDSHPENVNNILDDSLSSVSSYEQENATNQFISDLAEPQKQTNFIENSNSKKDQSKNSSPIHSMKDDLLSSKSKENLNSNPKASVLNELIQTVKKQPSIDDIEKDKIEESFAIPKSEPPPVAKPLNKARINEFATLLSSCVHLSQTPIVQKPAPTKTNPVVVPSPVRSEDQSQSFSSFPSATSDREERESYHTVLSNLSDSETKKKHIDARYNEKLDDRGSIQIKTANIKALFEQKISDTNRTNSTQQGSEHSSNSTEHRSHQHKRIPISFDILRKNLPPVSPTQNIRRTSIQDSTSMNKYTDHMLAAKEVVIEEKQLSPVMRPIQQYGTSGRRNNTDVIIRPSASAADSSMTSPVSAMNLFNSESLIAREIRETKEKEEELKRQRKKCGLAIDANALLTIATNEPIKGSNSNNGEPPGRNNSFLSNLDFFTSKVNTPNQETSTITSASPRRSSLSIQSVNSDSLAMPSTNASRQSSTDDRKQLTNVVSQELSRLSENGVPVVRTNSNTNFLHRSASNQNVQQAMANSNSNIVQREIEAIRAREAELRQMGRIQNTSDEHADPRKYQEFVSTLPKSQSANTVTTGKIRRDSDRSSSQTTPTSNTFIRSKPPTPSPSSTSIRGKFPSPSPTAPIVSSSLKSTDYSKLSSGDRLEMEKREVREREQELKRQRHSIIGSASTVTNNNHATNGDSGHASQEEHEDEQERYFDKIERMKRTENEKAQAPIIRPTKKSNLSQRWEQIVANKTATNGVGDDN